MTKQKLTILALLAVMAVSVPLAVDAARTTWIGVDCTPLKGGNVATCTDINSLDARITALEPAALFPNIIISAIDTNPAGDDSSSAIEWVTLSNQDNTPIDISNFQLASTTLLKKTLTIPQGTIIPANSDMTFTYQPVWFSDSNESVEFRNSNGDVVDKTPLLSDLSNDTKYWLLMDDLWTFIQ